MFQLAFHLPAGEQLQWNRVLLYVWPSIDVPIEELLSVARTLAPMTGGLGIEQVIVQGRIADAEGQLREIVVRVSRPPGAWQTYDIVFTAPRFSAAGALDKAAVVTVLHNGVVVHNATAFWGPTAHKKIDPYTPDTAKGPLMLQDHGNPVRFRNIWIRPLKGYDAQ